MNSFSLRIYIYISTIVWWIQAHAQSDDYSDDVLGRYKRGLDEMDEMMDGMQGIHISFHDILMVALLAVACYIFGKIWKGCTYMLILVAVALYFMTH